MRWRMFSTEIFSKSTMLSRWEKCWRREICIPQFFFTAMLIITKSLYCTCVATSTTSLILCLIINSQMTRKYVGHEEDGRRLQMSHVWELLRTCTPMFIGTFLSLLLYNIPKYAMAGVMTDEYQTYYSILFMPSFVISLMCEFVFKPTITTIAELWWENNVKKVHTVTYCGSLASSWSAV